MLCSWWRVRTCRRSNVLVVRQKMATRTAPRTCSTRRTCRSYSVRAMRTCAFAWGRRPTALYFAHVARVTRPPGPKRPTSATCRSKTHASTTTPSRRACSPMSNSKCARAQLIWAMAREIWSVENWRIEIFLYNLFFFKKLVKFKNNSIKNIKTTVNVLFLFTF